MDDMDLDTSGKRLRWARTRAGHKNAKDAARVVKMNVVSYRALENDQHGLTKHAAALARAFGVSVTWLIEGGPTPTEDPPVPGDLGTPLALADNYGIELVRKVDITYAMGDGSFIDDYPDVEYFPFSLDFLRKLTRSTTEQLFIASGHGDSMEPTLRRDDFVMIDPSQKRIAKQDEIWAVGYAGTGMIKRVRRLMGGAMQLLSDNPLVPPLEVKESDVYVVGKVVWTARVM